MNKLEKCFAIILSLALLLPVFSYSQSTFYYTFENQKEYLSPISDKWVVEFQEEITSDKYPGEKINNYVYLIDDISVLRGYPENYYLTPVYKTKNESIRVYLTSKLVLNFKSHVGSKEKLALVEKYKLKYVKKTSAYELYSCNDVLETSQQVYESGLVDFCHPDFICPDIKPLYIPNDEYFSKQYYLHNTGQQINDGHSGTTDADIDAPAAWDITKGSPNIVVAVVDQGVTSNHPDLPNSRQLRLNGSNIAGTVDGTPVNDPSPVNSATSGNNHGNACAGIIGATQDNGIGISGIAPLCKIMPVRVKFGALPSSHYADAITFAHNNGANVISNSWGGGSYSAVIVNAIENAINDGVVVVFAAGNTANHASGNNGYVAFPGNANITDLITVGASDRDDSQANYSPTDIEFEIVAPSHRSYNSQISGEAFDVWTIDIPGNYGYNKWRDSWSNPLPAVGEFLPSWGTDPLSYTGRMGGTSAATPQVAAVAALMLSVNSCLDPHEIKSMLQNTADKVGGYNYNWSSSSPGHSKEMGYGRLNAHAAVLAAQSAYTPPLDLFMRDRLDDSGADAGYQWTWDFDDSPDIWVRNQDDGLVNQQHQNPEYSGSSPVYVYVRVGNRSCTPSTGDEELSLYWSQASSDASWPMNWDGSSPTTGDQVGTLNIPVLLPGESTILKFTWNILNPVVHNNWNSCLLARIENSPYDPITLHMNRLSLDVYHNNNVSLRNCVVTDIYPGLPYPIIDHERYPYGSYILLGNVNDRRTSYDIVLTVPDDIHGVPITKEAEVTLRFDDRGWEIFREHFNGRDDIKVLDKNRIVMLKEKISFDKIDFPANTRVPVYVGFDFFTEELGEKNEFEYHVVQKYTERHPELGDNWTGGVHFYVSRLEGRPYKSGFDSNNEILKDKPVNTNGVQIKSLIPNPASEYVMVDYKVGNAMSAYLLVFESANPGVSRKYILDCKQTKETIDISSFKTGVYSVILVCDGQVVNTKSLIVN